MPEPPFIRILYDGDCPICGRKIIFLKRRDQNNKLHFSNIRNADVQTLKIDIPMADLEKQIHAILPDGKIITRMEAIRAAHTAIGIGWVTAPTKWTLLRPLFDRLYDFVAKHRFSISRFFR